MKTSFIAALLSLSLPLLAQVPNPSPSLPPASNVVVKQFQAFEEKTRQDAERSINAARERLIALLMEQSRAAAGKGDAVLIDAYLAELRGAAREAAAPDTTEFWNKAELSVGYYNNNPLVPVNVGIVGKKRFLVIEGNQDKVATEGEIYLVRGTTDIKVGDWKTGMANPLTYDVTGNITKPGEYVFKFRYRNGGNGFKSDKVGVTVKKG